MPNDRNADPRGVVKVWDDARQHVRELHRRIDHEERTLESLRTQLLNAKADESQAWEAVQALRERSEGVKE